MQSFRDAVDLLAEGIDVSRVQRWKEEGKNPGRPALAQTIEIILNAKADGFARKLAQVWGEYKFNVDEYPAEILKELIDRHWSRILKKADKKGGEYPTGGSSFPRPTPPMGPSFRTF